MKAGLTEQRMAAAVTAVSLVASLTLVIDNPHKGVSDPLVAADSVSATLIDPYYLEDYVVDRNDYACDKITVTA